ncbi:hypothetical protein [Rubripirellula reticaptiva]|uniref:Zinc finger/thioredoxin putative domain-containing protein n=1 Tax=Rubripirellula reticaptiva TaxID=2528013 RepID=A0A5C6EHD0_9BACT|nr:hypothetical protein [Rubripirellula reticaptiva]TWU47081.1 hypothetical protein Poly59_60550 [Rubripirellula reticaptiva]
MLTVKCPKCATALKLAQAPASGRVKCPKCAAIVAVKPSAGASAPARAPAARPAAAAASVDPDDDNFDFGRISFPTASTTAAVSHFPTSGQATLFEGPIPGDPLEIETDASGSPVDGGGEAGGPIGKPGKKKTGGLSTAAVVRLAVGLIALIVCTGIAVVVWKSRGSGGPSAAETIAKLQQSSPDGYKAYGFQGAVALMPKGDEFDNLPSVIDCMAVTTDKSRSVFFFGAMNGGSLPLDNEQMRKKAGRQLGGEILGGNDTERNGYKGIKGILDGSIFLPRMMVEVYHIDERFCILGSAPASFGADPSAEVDRALEAEEQKVFYDSFKVGAKPAGFWAN